MNDSQIYRAAELLQKEFGTEWQAIAGMLGTEGLRKRVGKELTSFMAFPERGQPLERQLLSGSGCFHSALCPGLQALLRQGCKPVYPDGSYERFRDFPGCSRPFSGTVIAL